jgi:hypothetical protein
MSIVLNSFVVGGGFETTIRRHRALSAALETKDPERVQHVTRQIRAVPRNMALYDIVEQGFDANLIVNESLDKLLNVWLSGSSANSAHYVSLYKSNSTPLATWTSATYRSLVTEFEDYDESTRPAWTEVGAASQSITNTASPAEFTCNNSATATIYGAALLSASSKTGAGDAAGTLVAATKYSTGRTVQDTDVAAVRYTINAAST